MKSKAFLVNSINWYQRYISSRIQPRCVFYPSCSAYTKEAIIKHGAIKGVSMGFRRVLRCHPFQKNNIDPVK